MIRLEPRQENESQGEASSQLWKRMGGWRIAGMVFGVVFSLQAVLSIVSLRVYENEQLKGLKDAGQAALVLAIGDTHEQLTSPFQEEAIGKILKHTMIEGLAVYSMDYTVIKAYGAPLVLHPGIDKKSVRSYRSVDNLHYEVTYAPNEIGHPYNVVARLDASEVAANVSYRTKQLLVVLLCLPLFITGLLMLALDQLLLEPMVRRNDNMISAARSEAEDKIHRLAYYDALTKLPNRSYFLEHIDENIRLGTQGQTGSLAVFSVDLDHFKDVNDAMGHDVGDKMLEVVAQRLVEALPETAVVARLTADEFAVALILEEGQPDSDHIAEKMYEVITRPIEIMRENFLMRASIGVSLYPQDGSDGATILKNADIALNRAKAEGRSTVRHYSHDFNLAVQQRSQMLRDLRKALDNNELQLHYHPQFDLRTGALIGVEALLRWWKPDSSKEGGKFISPAEFIPVAEQSGLIVPIGEYVLRMACKTNKSWQDMGLPPFRVAVNISGIQFHKSDLVSLVQTVLNETRLDPKWLELELTESIFIDDAQSAIDILDQLHEIGVELAVDDFGTGYSSLSYLRQFPIDRLKIDQSFVRASLLNTNDRMITRAIISLGHSLGLNIIAEGVETQDHEDLLREEGCDEVQGFKYTKPLPPNKLYDYAFNHNKQLAESKSTYIVE